MQRAPRLKVGVQIAAPTASRRLTTLKGDKSRHHRLEQPPFGTFIETFDLMLCLANNQELLDYVEEPIAYMHQVQQDFPIQGPDTAFLRL